ncbi:MAG: class I SAM-dependent methyltransferase [Candidatus Altiarchaeota archaeon]
MKRKHIVCPHYGSILIDNWLRRLIHDPKKIFKPYIKQGYTVLDVGCGPGTFTLDLARMVGEEGVVIALDLQQEMLDKVSMKVGESSLGSRVVVRKCSQDSLDISDKVDFALAFHMAHEVPDVTSFLKQLRSVLKPEAKLLLVEPVFHVSSREFEETVEKAVGVGLKPVSRDRIFLSRAVTFKN